MRKLIRVMLPVLAMLTLLCACAQAEGTLDTSLLIPASADAPLSESYVPDGLMQISAVNEGVHLAAARTMLLKEEALTPLYEMLQAAESDGTTLFIRQAYRSYADEKRRYDTLSATGQAAQRPGESSYQTGLSVTLVGADWRTKELTAEIAQSSEAQWLSEHAADYGFVLRYPKGKEDLTGWEYEPWHYRYVGREAAAMMAQQGWCLEELIDESGLDIPMPAGSGKPATQASGGSPSTKRASRDDDDEDDGEDYDDVGEDESAAGSRSSVGRSDHAVPKVVDMSTIDPEDIGPDGDYDISLFGD